MKKKLLIVGLIMVMCLGVFSGCEHEIPYNAELLGSGMVYEVIPEGFFFTDSFWENNMTLGASYKNENWDHEDPQNEYLFDKTSPKNRLHIVTDQNKYDSIFRDYRQVDFENSMIIVYLFTSHGSGIAKLTNVKLENEVLTIEYTHITSDNRAVAPHRRYMAVQMDKVEFESVKFVHKRR